MEDPEQLALRSVAGAPAAAAGEESGFAPRAIEAGQWRLASSLLQGVLQLGVGALLARLLPPADFGLIALAAVVIGFASLLGELGIGSSLIQRQPLTARDVRAGFTISVLWGSGLAAVIFASAPLWAGLLASPALVPVLRVQALLFVLAGLGSTALAMLRRALQFRQVFVVETVSYIVGYALVAVGMALAGFGIWSLVCGAVVQRFLSSALALVWVRHPVQPLFARNEFRSLLGFGVAASLNQMVGYVARNADNVITGRWLGTTMLGLYSRAFNLVALPIGYVDSVMWGVLYPVLARLRDEPARFKRGYILSLQLTSLVSTPSMAALFVAAPYLITGLYGDRWAGAVAPLQVLCCAGPLRAVYNVAGTVTHASGRVYAELVRQVGYVVLVVGGSVAGLRFGVTGVAWGVAVAVACMYLAMAHLSARLSGCTWRSFLGAQVPGWALAIFVGACGLAVRVALESRGVERLWILAGTLLSCAVALPVGLYLLPAEARPAELFAHLGQSARFLPPVLRDRVLWALRVQS